MLKRFGLVALVAIMLTSCGKSYTPKEVADNFFKAIQAKNYDEAGKFATPTGVAAVGQLKDFVNADPTSVKFNFSGIAEPVIVGDSVATVAYTNEGVAKTANLKKIDGDWLIDITIEDLLGDAGAPVETPMEPVVEPTADAKADTAKK